MMNAIRVATSSCGPVALIPSVTGWNASGSEYNPEAKTAGIASRNPNRAARRRSSPRNNPALIVDPDRETPGTKAKRLRNTHHYGIAPAQLLDMTALATHTFRERDYPREHHQRRCHYPQIANTRSDFILE